MGDRSWFVDLPPETMEMLLEALAYYGDPMTYFGIAMLGDAPHGSFFDDFERYPFPGDYSIQDKPGRRAREALRKLALDPAWSSRPTNPEGDTT